jgi:hypothetical protein
MGLIKNFIGFQIGWFACVVGAAQGYPLVAVAVASIIVILHLLRDNNLYSELCLIISAVFIGIIWESLLLASGWLAYASSGVVSVFAPIWLVAMWALFATTINHSMAWLKNRYFLALLLGAVFGPLAFIAGENLGAVMFLDRTMALTSLAVGWAVLMPLLLWLAEQFKHRINIMES